MRILGLSGYHRDAAACLIEDGVVIAAALERTLDPREQHLRVPVRAMQFCLAAAGPARGSVDAIAYHEQPLARLQRVLESHFAIAPRGLRRFVETLPDWMRWRIWVEAQIEDALEQCSVEPPGTLHFVEHHLAQLSSAFHASPFDAAAVIVLDGPAEWTTTSIASGTGREIRVLAQLDHPHSLGTLCAALARQLGFHGGALDKLVGLAAFGEPRFAGQILEELVDVKADGSFRLSRDSFSLFEGEPGPNPALEALFGHARMPEFAITRRELDLAASIQRVLEEVALRIARHAQRLTASDRLCLGGELSANCMLNARLLREAPFREQWIQPAGGDAGSAIGAALWVWHEALGRERPLRADDAMGACRLGPEFGPDEIRAFLDGRDIPYREMPENEAPRVLARLLAEGHVLGIFEGRLEFGPCALGGRSIFADPRNAGLVARLNASIKLREGFRPVAAACLEERVADWFELDRPSPYMQLAVPLRAQHRLVPTEAAADTCDLEARLACVRSAIPAVTHVDYSTRVLSVGPGSPHTHALLRAFEAQTGCPILATTALRVRGEPLVATPLDAYRCFCHGELDYLAIGPFLLDRLEQKMLPDPDWSRPISFD